MATSLTLVSHTLCPYVQRAAILLDEKNQLFERIYIDLANKPAWFKRVSPLGKVPLLKIADNNYLFESAPILEYLDETIGVPFHPQDPAERARHRAYIEFASQILNAIGTLYNAKDQEAFRSAEANLRSKFEHLETALSPDAPFFSGKDFSLVDCAFAPVFRYFDVFESFTHLTVLDDLKNTKNWRVELASRPSVQRAVKDTYAEDLKHFLHKRDSWMSELLRAHETATAAAE
ncbi:glutathione S-transferase family protein [Labrenzia sp. PHM005]|uniref:glutathione S-transferase family protein n=1 Tax=Labrenzia sp. PHM005 TaxID=2590016 RepID=UPI001140256F|nr:glutathione S-transferase family protein [Labrenzia sp. PHM005]QDG79113.1 glutathione S-transferase family protein [Labrenzia sp. PHM005]